MRSKLLKVMKTILVSVLAFSIVALVNINMSKVVNATEVESVEEVDTGVRYVKYKNLNVEDYFGKTAPEYVEVNELDGVGYFFGGWYEKTGENSYKPIGENDLEQVANEDVVAKFVPAQTLSVKCQNWAGTTKDIGPTNVRIISAVDSTNYASYGFEITRADEETGWKPVGTYTADSGEVYSTFNYYEKQGDKNVLVAKFSPNQLFGNAAQHFTTTAITGIPSEAYGTIICIKPFWVTLDGITVYGLSKFAHVEDGYLNYINVPVNVNILNENNKAVAGMLNVISENDLEFVGVEYGKLFDEMDTNTVTSGGKVIVRCVGNMSKFDANDQKKEMDIYVNLRFQGKPVEDFQNLPHYTFTVTDEEFCNAAKEISTADVWNIKY